MPIPRLASTADTPAAGPLLSLTQPEGGLRIGTTAKGSASTPLLKRAFTVGIDPGQMESLRDRVHTVGDLVFLVCLVSHRIVVLLTNAAATADAPAWLGKFPRRDAATRFAAQPQHNAPARCLDLPVRGRRNVHCAGKCGGAGAHAVWAMAYG
eukprot:COSAG05_NODE_1504_length_4692_cov_2.598737_5_plen_153_part_00